MSQLEKLKEELRNCQGPFPYTDLVALLGHLGYSLAPRGKTGGSRRKFHNAQTNDLIMIHAPHKKDVKPYAAKAVRQHLEGKGLL